MEKKVEEKSTELLQSELTRATKLEDFFAENERRIAIFA